MDDETAKQAACKNADLSEQFAKAKISSLAARFAVNHIEHLHATDSAPAEAIAKFVSNLEMLITGDRSGVAFLWHPVTGGSVEFALDHSKKMIAVTYKDKSLVRQGKEGLILKEGYVEIPDGIIPEAVVQSLLARGIPSLQRKGPPVHLSSFIDLSFADFDPPITTLERKGKGSGLKLTYVRTHIPWKMARSTMFQIPSERDAA